MFEKLIKWMKNNPNANPGGHDDMPDLFDAPLGKFTADVNRNGMEWTGDRDTGGWRIGKSPYIISPNDCEVWHEETGDLYS